MYNITRVTLIIPIIIIAIQGCVRKENDWILNALHSRHRDSIRIAVEVLNKHDGRGFVTINYNGTYESQREIIQAYVDNYGTYDEEYKEKLNAEYSESRLISSPIWLKLWE